MSARDVVVRSHLEAVMEVSWLINSSLDTEDVKVRSILATTRLLGAEAGSLILRDTETGDLSFDVSVGDGSDCVRHLRLPRGRGLAGWVAERGEPAVVDDARADPRFCGDIDRLTGFVTRSLVCVPLRCKGVVIGVLEALNKRSGPFVPEDVTILEVLANQVAVALENARLYREAGEMFGAVIEALLETVEKRDTYTSGHTRRVTGHSVAIGQALGLARTDLEDLRLAAMLHDIGKIGISDRVLQKDGELTEEEFEAIRYHPVYGADILQHIRKLHCVLPGVRHHHERYNGLGYPGRLKGSDIPFIARIIAVADTFDAMVTDRPYRKGLKAQAALEELKRQRGAQFDPVVVAAFLDGFRFPCGDR